MRTFNYYGINGETTPTAELAVCYEVINDDHQKIYFIKANHRNTFFKVQNLEYDNASRQYAKQLGLRHDPYKWIQVNKACFSSYVTYLTTKSVQAYKSAERQIV